MNGQTCTNQEDKIAYIICMHKFNEMQPYTFGQQKQSKRYIYICSIYEMMQSKGLYIHMDSNES